MVTWENDVGPLIQIALLFVSLLFLVGAVRELGFKMKMFGRNQLIGIGVFGVILVASIIAVPLSETLTAKDWLDWSLRFGPIAAGVILGSSMGIKVAGILKNGKQPKR